MSQEKLSRRNFFSKVVIGGAATAAAAVATTVAVGGKKPDLLAQAGEAAKPAGYRESEHVKAYYRSTQV